MKKRVLFIILSLFFSLSLLAFVIVNAIAGNKEKNSNELQDNDNEPTTSFFVMFSYEQDGKPAGEFIVFNSFDGEEYVVAQYMLTDDEEPSKEAVFNRKISENIFSIIEKYFSEAEKTDCQSGALNVKMGMFEDGKKNFTQSFSFESESDLNINRDNPVLYFANLFRRTEDIVPPGTVNGNSFDSEIEYFNGEKESVRADSSDIAITICNDNETFLILFDLYNDGKDTLGNNIARSKVSVYKTDGTAEKNIETEAEKLLVCDIGFDLYMLVSGNVRNDFRKSTSVELSGDSSCGTMKIVMMIATGYGFDGLLFDDISLLFK